MEIKQQSEKSSSSSPKQMRLYRRRRAMKRLELQLGKGVKMALEEDTYKEVPLTETDKIRIKHEIAILKSRI